MKRTVLAAASLLALAACGGDDGVTVDGAWSRTNPVVEAPGVVYFDLTAAEDDRLVSASVPSDVAARAEIHEVVSADEMGDTDDMEMSGEMSDEMSDEMDDMEMSEGSEDMDEMSEGMDGMMTMREMSDGLSLAGGETVTFAPGGYHVMLMDLADPLDAGDEFELTLGFENADDLTVTVQVADEAP